MRFFARLAESFRRFMAGRRGMDTLGIVLLVGYLFFSLITNFFRALPVGYYICEAVSVGLFVWFVFRFFSRNLLKRQLEDVKVKNFLTTFKNRFRDRKTHAYFRCPACKNVLRVPKGRGKITVTCPVCREQIRKKT